MEIEIIAHPFKHAPETRSVSEILGDFFQPWPFVRTPVVESVQIVQGFLDGQHQVVSLGVIGWFDTYTVVPVTDAHYAHDKEHDNERWGGTLKRSMAAGAYLKKVHPLSDLSFEGLKKAPIVATDTLAMNSSPARKKVTAALLYTTQGLQSLGLPKQRTTIVFGPIGEAKGVSKITGTGVGGFAARAKHGIVVNRDAELNSEPMRLVAVIAHEWAHMYWYQMSKGRKSAFVRWYQNYVVKSGTRELEKSVETLFKKEWLIRSLWTNFSKEYAKQQSTIRPEDHHAVLSQHETATPEAEKEIAFRHILGGQGKVIGTTTKELKNSQDKLSPAGTKVSLTGTAEHHRFINVDVSGPVHMFLDPPNGAEFFTMDSAIECVDIDVDASYAASPKVKRLTVDFDKPEVFSKDAEWSFRRAFIFGATETAKEVSRTLERYQKDDALRAWRGDGGYERSIFSAEAVDEIQKDFLNAAHAAGKSFKPEQVFKTLVVDHADLDFFSGNVEPVLNKPEGDSLRDFIASKGLAPTSYAVSNPLELWAETVSYLVINPSKVSPALKKAFVASVQGSLKESLDEATKLYRSMQGYSTEVIDLGTIGFFHLYAVASMGQAAVTARVVDLPADYVKQNGSGLKTAKPTAAVKTAVTDAVAAIQRLGLPTQHSDVFFTDLSSKKNQNTGGGVGGYAHKKDHGISLDFYNNDSEKWRREALVHEWAHLFWFRLPKHSKALFTDWYRKNVIAPAKENSDAVNKLPADFHADLLAVMWKAFDKSFGHSRNVLTPSDYMKVRRRHVDFKGVTEQQRYSTPHDQVNDLYKVEDKVHAEIATRYYFSHGAEIVAEVRATGLKDDVGKTVRKGSYVVAYTGSHTEKIHVFRYDVKTRDVGQLLLPPSGMQSGDDLAYFTIDEFVNSFLISPARTKASNEKLGKKIEEPYERGVMNHSPETGEPKPVADEFVPNRILNGQALDAAVEKGLDYLAKYRSEKWKGRSILTYTKHEALANDFYAAAKAAGLDFNPETTFKALLDKYLDLSGPKSGDVELTITTAEGNDLKDYIASRGITPSSYAASNVDELWAETLTYCALNRARASKALLHVFVDVLHGKG